MGRRRASRFAAALVAASLLATAACSGGDDDGGEAAATSSPTTSTTVPTFTGDPDSPFCGLLRDVQLQGVLDGDAATPAEVEAAFTAVLDALGRLADQSPPELAEDTALVLAGMVALDDALRAVGYSYDALAEDPQRAVEVSRAANDPAFAEASTRIEAYRTQVCQL